MKRTQILAATLLALAPAALAQDRPVDNQRRASADEVPSELSRSDWAGIRAAYEANRHAVFAVEGGYRARCSGQRWSTRFDGRGFTVAPDAGGWTWGLELESYGFAGEERRTEQAMRVRADGQRMVYEWDGILEEWYVNDRRGLEHGYTVQERPSSDAEGPLSFNLAVRGGLLPEVQADRRGVSFVNGDGARVVTYTGLTVMDANGRALSARFACAGDGLRLVVEEHGAAYPLTIDPIAQQAYLKASNTDVGDTFGYSVPVSGDTVVVGADGESSAASGVDGNQSDNSAVLAGAAYVFIRKGPMWSQQAYLKASNTEALDSFGWSVSVAGDTIVVGARTEDSGSTGVNGNQSDNSKKNSGAAYVFVRNGTTWSQQAYLKASNTGITDQFGYSVAVSGDIVVVGAYQEDSAATGVNGTQSDNSAYNAGAAYVFSRTGTTWNQQAYLKASNTDPGDEFGLSVSASGDTVVVGAWGEASNARGIDGDQTNNAAPASGAAYVFLRKGTMWSQQAYVKASNTDAFDLFGFRVSLSDDTLAVGAGGEASAATGVDGKQSDNSATDSGAAYVFVRNGTKWSQQAYLKASNTDVGDEFSASVSASGNTVVVGALREDSAANGVNGNQADNSAPDSGAAYVFVRNGTTWNQQAYLKASNTDPNDLFGLSASISGDTVVVGAPLEDSAATGVDGNQSSNSGPDSGAAYVFQVLPPCGPITTYGSGCAGTGGLVPALSVSGCATPGGSVTLTLQSAKPGSFGLIFAGLTETAIPAGCGCTLNLQPVLVEIPVATDGAGTFTSSPSIPPAAAIAPVKLQAFVTDAATACGFSNSNGVSVTIQ